MLSFLCLQPADSTQKEKRSILKIGVRVSRCSSNILVITSDILQIVVYVVLRGNFSKQIIWGAGFYHIMKMAQSSIPSSVAQVLPTKFPVKTFPACSSPHQSPQGQHNTESVQVAVYNLDAFGDHIYDRQYLHNQDAV